MKGKKDFEEIDYSEDIGSNSEEGEFDMDG